MKPKKKPAADHDPLHAMFVVAHMNMFGSTAAQARKKITEIYRRDYGRDPPPTKPLSDPDMIAALEGLMLTLSPRQQASIRARYIAQLENRR